MTNRIPIPDGSGFGLDNLPLGVSADGRAWTAVGDHAVEVALAGRAGPTVEDRLADWPALRARIREQLEDGRLDDATAVVPRSSLAMALPITVGDYVDGYGSLHHATNLGRLFRPDGEALLPNWRHLPVAYHGRSSTIVVSGSDVPRPRGLRGPADFGPSERLDLELEVGFVVGVGNERGTAIPIDRFDDHVAGWCLVNDWSARDLQAFEYQPLGPFLGKSFATSMSPWLVSNDALRPFRVASPAQDPPAADHLRAAEPWGLDLHLEVLLDSAAMRTADVGPLLISSIGFADHYWTPAQQLAHVTVNGAATRPGDLLASGTVSGPTLDSVGSLIERTNGGRDPIELPDGTTRTFLLDGDRVTLRGWAGDRDGGGPWVDLGDVTGTVTPAPAPAAGPVTR